MTAYEYVRAENRPLWHLAVAPVSPFSPALCGYFHSAGWFEHRPKLRAYGVCTRCLERKEPTL